MRVVISGMGVISALGHDQQEFWQALANGQSGIGPIPQDVGPSPEMGMNQVRFKNGASVREYDADTHFARTTLNFMDRFAQFSVIAAREAVAAAGIEWTEELRESAATEWLVWLLRITPGLRQNRSGNAPLVVGDASGLKTLTA